MMDELSQAIAYFEEAIRESGEIISECSHDLQKELTEQKRHFEVALEAMRRPVRENKPLTLEQLERRSSPVWVPLDDGTGYWCLCCNGEITPPSCYPFMAKDLPNWTFLDRDPEV